MDFTSDFQPRQILCLEHEGICLYAEVIQVVVSRQLCWVRPLLLGVLTKSTQLSPWDGERMLPSDSFSFDETLLLTDLRFEADLLWPITLFRPALDIEVIPLLAMLPSLPQSERDPTVARRLNQFIHQVWQAYKGAFSPSHQA